MSTLKVNAFQDTSGKGFYPARTWINFDGEATISIRDDENVSSITDNGSGNYQVTFSNNMSNANYATTFGSQWDERDTVIHAYLMALEIRHSSTAVQTSNVKLWHRYGGSTTLYDANILCCAIHGDM